MNVALATTVRVRFFASLREAAGVDAVDLRLRDPCVSGVYAALADVLDEAQLAAVRATGVQVAVNQAIVREDAPLAAGDEVAFLPPVTGG